MKKSRHKVLRQKAALLALVSVLTCGSTGMVYAADQADSSKQKEELIKSLSAKEQPGDINGDGIINVFDLMRYKNSIVEGKKFDDAERLDANSDGAVNGKDITAVKNDILKQSKLWNYKSMPKMDGSTSAIPLEAGLKSKMLGVNYSDAKQLVSHHKTHESFQMLLNGENDLIFTVPISEDQKKAADEAGVKLNFVPVAKEGFVFVVNKSNPVDSLTKEQIRDIYSGKITNWKEVGGNDEKIVPYQRNKDSGSQNYMTEFMEGFDLMDPPKTYVLGSMAALMDGLAVYDNAENAIGYSVYSYAAQMYENSSDTKFIAVDGIKPTRETMADGTYPLLSSTSIVYTDKASQNTKDFAAWAVSEEGQQSVLASGYVPVKDMEYPEELKPYSAKGTGKERPADYKPAEKYSSTYHILYDGDDLGPERCSIDFLKDKEFEKQINSDIAAVFDAHEFKSSYQLMSVNIMNGYMCIRLIDDEKYMGNDVSSYGYIATLNYDLKNGKKIEKFSDYFFKDTDFVQAVNNRIGSNISVNCPEIVKTDYLGLLGDVTKFSFTDVVLEKDGPYLSETAEIPFLKDHDLIDIMVTGEYFDNSQVLDEKFLVPQEGEQYAKIHVQTTTLPEWVEYLEQGDDGEAHTRVTSRFHTESEIAEKNSIYDKIFEKAKELRAQDRWTKEWLEFYPDKKITDMPIKLLRELPSTYYTHYNVIFAHLGKVDGDYNSPYMFDVQTGEQVMISDIFGKSFEKYDDYRYTPLYIDLDKGTVRISEYGVTEDIEEKIRFDELDLKYISLANAKPESLDILQKAFVIGDDKAVSVYPDSYVVGYGGKKAAAQIKDLVYVKGKKKCASHGQTWYECFDGQTDEKIGWICEDDLIRQGRFFDYKKYDTPVYGVALGDESGSVVGYTSAYILKKGEKEVQWPIEGKWNVKIVAEAYNDNTERVYECYDADDGDYYGWIPGNNLLITEERSFKGKAKGTADKPVYGYKSSYVLEGGTEEKQWPIEGDWNVKGNRTAKWPDGTIWYECYDADDGDYYGWVRKSDLTLE